MELFSAAVIPMILVVLSLVLLFSRRDYFEEFIAGVKEGLMTGAKLTPTLIALVVAVSMFSSSGVVGLLSEWLSPLGERIGVPAELLPLLLTRPVSGSASTAVLNDLFGTYGADSFVALCASVIMGSSDTLIYVVAVYYSAVGIRRTRHTVPAALAVMLFCIFFSCFLCRLFFG